jgi:purine nucleosidase
LRRRRAFRRCGISETAQGGALHDPLAVAATIWPDLLEWADLHVHVELQEGANLGRTTCDVYGVTERPANARVAVGVDDEAFFTRLLERLAALP